MTQWPDFILSPSITGGFLLLHQVQENVIKIKTTESLKVSH